MATGTKPKNVRRVDVPCNIKGCIWRGHDVPENKATNIRAMHVAKVHPEHSVLKDTSHRAKAIRRGAVPQFLDPGARRVISHVTEKFNEGAYYSNQRLIFTDLIAETDAGITAVRTALWHLARQRPPLVSARDGKFYVVGGQAKPPSTDDRPVSALVGRVAQQLRAGLGTTYPLGPMPRSGILAKDLGCSLTSIQRALKVLEREGLVDVRVGVKGSTVIRLPDGTTEPEREPTAPVTEPEPEPQPSEPEPEPLETARHFDPVARAFDFLTRLADIGATAELQRLWALEETALSGEDWAKLEAEVERLQAELNETHIENRNLASGIKTLRDKETDRQQEYRTLKESYVNLQSAHQRTLDDYRHLESVAQLVGAPQLPTNGPSRRLAVEAALGERKPLPHRRSY